MGALADRRQVNPFDGGVCPFTVRAEDDGIDARRTGQRSIHPRRVTHPRHGADHRLRSTGECVREWGIVTRLEGFSRECDLEFRTERGIGPVKRVEDRLDLGSRDGSGFARDGAPLDAQPAFGRVRAETGPAGERGGV
jgi:hypothetical protein